MNDNQSFTENKNDSAANTTIVADENMNQTDDLMPGNTFDSEDAKIDEYFEYDVNNSSDFSSSAYFDNEDHSNSAYKTN